MTPHLITLKRIAGTVLRAKDGGAARLLAYAELVTSLGLAAYAQHIIDDGGSYGEGWPLLSSFDTKLNSIYNAPQSVAYSIPLFFLAAGLFVHSLSRILSNRPAAEDSKTDSGPAQDRIPKTPRFIAAGVLFATALAVWSYLIYQLAAGGNQPENLWLFWGSLIGAAGALLLIDVGGKVTLFSTLRWHPLEVAFVAVVTSFFIGLMVQDLTSWQYARIGDEGAFWEFGKRIAEGDHNYNYFSTRGPFGYHPVLSSVYQGMVMRLGGVSMLSWKLSSTIAIAASLPPFYWLVRTSIGLRAAIFSTAILASSHVLFAYAHTGYSNIFALFPAIVAFALYASGSRSKSVLLLFGSGVAAGMGFYTFYTARTVILILVLATMIVAIGEWRRGELFRWIREVPLPIAAGFSMAVMPIFAVHGRGVFDTMTKQSLWYRNDFETVMEIVIESIPRAFLAFNFHRPTIHYVSGSLLDEITAVLALLGLAYALYRVMKPEYRFILIWAVVAIVVTGVLHQRPFTELPTRMNFAIPPMAVFAGIAVDRVVLAISNVYRNRRFELAVSIVAFLLVLPAIFGFNAHRFWKVTPSIQGLSGTTVIYREAMSDLCNIEDHRSVVFVSARAYHGVRSVFFWYNIENKSPLVLDYGGPADVYEELVATTRVSCVMFTNPKGELAQPLIESYQGRAGGVSFLATDSTGRHAEVMVLDWRGVVSETDD